ncbi:mannose-1-phosphate guanylyltransferase [Alicyclobacillus ferrooxydans]|uniref:mannose-1-phosphate guanylyltransferase n=1 Tax=Alicyclobacillus ferrooxydans TaxID=471514 RepID=UPI0006D53400|nr:sugar phosphate nucleotidyltransferase [Alicyclobacillus ferrooxydans]
MESSVKVLLMTGGSGTRLWPKSRKSIPKQFMSLGTRKTLFQQTLSRVMSLVPKDSVYAVTPPEYLQHIESQAPEIPVSQMIVEPMQHSTTASLGYATMWLKNQGASPDDVVVILPTDAYVGDDSQYIKTLQEAIAIARNTDGIVTIGIQPDYPATGYGYIQCTPDKVGQTARQVRRFVEKPDEVQAQKYLAQGDYFWNAGMFVWKVSTIWNLFHELMPKECERLSEMEAMLKAGMMVEPTTQAGKRDEGSSKDSSEAGVVQRIASSDTNASFAALKAKYQQMPKQSFEYSIVERAPELYMVPGEFEWTDLGTWSVLLSKLGKGSSGKNVVAMDADGCLVDTGQKLVGLLGVQNLIVVNTEDTVFICHRDRDQDVKKFRRLLKERGYEDLL